MWFAIDRFLYLFAQDDGLEMYIGPAFDRSLLEVGVVTADSGQMAVVHAMKARAEYIRTRPGR